MGLILAAVVAVLAASCATSSERAVIERRASSEAATTEATGVCEDIEAFALGSHGGEPLEVIVDEAARLAALLGANDALPPLSDIRVAATSGEPMAEAMHAVAEALYRHSFETCQIPAFTAMYVTTSFSSCFGRAPIAAGTMVPDSSAYESGIAPPFLPFFDESAGYIPIDCRDRTSVVVRDQAWVIG